MIRFLFLWPAMFILPGISEARSSTFHLTESYANSLAEKLFKVMGGQGLSPVVDFVPTERLAACSVSGDRPEIHIDQDKVIDKLEARFGAETDADDALACILGHEIWHIIKHKKTYTYKYWGNTTSDFETKAAEIDADMHGLIGAYFIGMTRSIEIYSDIFPALDFRATTIAYPRPEERSNVETEIKKRAKELFYLYEGGNCLLATDSRQNLEQAIVVYEHIGEQFHFLKQINFDIGLAHLRLALAESKIQYLFPLEPAPNPLSGLQHVRAGAGGGNTQAQNLHLEQAADYFEKAMVQDAEWFDAWLGMAAVKMVRVANDPLQKQYTFNVYEAGNTWKRAHPGLKPWDEDRLKALEAIAYLLQSPVKEKKKAIEYLSAIQSGSSDWALQLQACHNLRACGEDCSASPGLSAALVSLAETDGVNNAQSTYEQNRKARDWANMTDSAYSVLQKDLKNSHVLIIEQEQSNLNFPTVIQFYSDCSSLKRNAKTDHAEYRYFPGAGGKYDVISWQTAKEGSKCAKILTIH